MRRRCYAFGVLALTIAAPLTALSMVRTQPQKPVQIYKVDYTRPPATLQDLWSEADAVVRVRVISAATEAIPTSRPESPQVFTRTSAQLLEAFKFHPALGQLNSNITIRLSAGQVDVGDRLIRVDGGYEPFSPNQEYILFLGWHDGVRYFDVAYGPDGTLQVTGPVVITPAKFSPLRELNNTPVAALMELLRQLG